MNWSFSFVASVILLTVVWAIPLYFLNALGEAIILGDPCRYHSETPSAVFNIFYDLPAWNGYHPVPSVFNLGLTVFAPAGYFAVRTAKKIFAGRNL